MKPTIVTQYTHKLYNWKTEDKFLPSITVPDDTMSIQEIVRNHTRGLPSNAKIKTPVFLGEDEMPDFANMDNIDREDLLHAAKSEISAIQTEFQEQQKQKRDSLKKDQNKPPTKSKILVEPPPPGSAQANDASDA